MDWSHRRRIGLLTPASLTSMRKISSPSRPASQALMISVTSARFISRLSILKRSSLLLDGLEFEFLRDDRQGGERPLAALFVHLAGQRQLDEVADGGGDDVLVVLEGVVLALEAAQRAGDVSGNAGFFGDDESFGHGNGRATIQTEPDVMFARQVA